MAKDAKSLEESRQIRSLLESKWGSIPGSVMRADWSESVIDLSKGYQEQREASKYADTPFALSSVGARHGGLSRMPQNIVRFGVQFYTPERLGDKEPGYFGNYLPTVLDPFAGHNSRAETTFRCNRNYVGYDISQSFSEMNRKVKQMLEEENSRAMFPVSSKIELIEGDSRNIDYDEQFDFCLTSPPFYDLELESYGPEPEQLGRGKSYKEFLWSLGQVAERCRKALKPGAFLAWELNDFTRDGVFHPFAFDMMQKFKEVGLLLHQVIVIDYRQGFLQSFASDMEVHHLVSKEHSYLVVARKWAAQKKSRPQVRRDLLKEVQSPKQSLKQEERMGYQCPLLLEEEES